MATMPRMKTYILERTQNFFVSRSDEPCSGAARLVPIDSGAAPILPTDSTVALLSPGCSGAILPSSAMVEVYPWPLPTVRETCTS
jgi:hypothetical protein